jgi:Clp amino terminal domain, pathogenicity island component
MSERYARKLNHPLIGTEHLLLAPLHQEECRAAQTVEKFRSRQAPLNPSDFE